MNTDSTPHDSFLGNALHVALQVAAPGIGAAQRRIDRLHSAVLFMVGMKIVLYLPEVFFLTIPRGQLWSDGIEVVQDVGLLLLFAWGLRLIKRDLARPLHLSAQGAVSTHGEA